MIIKTDLIDQEETNLYKQAFDSSQFSSNSSFLRHVIRVYLLREKPSKKIAKEIKPVNKTDLKLVEFTVSIPKFIRKKADQVSLSYGLKPTAYIRNLITANLTKTPMFTPELVNELRASNRELNAIGININQLTKILNRSAELKLRDRVHHQHLIDIKIAIEKQTKAINEMVAKSNNVWRIE